MSALPALRITSLVRSFKAGRNRTAVVTPVNDVSFEVKKGEVFAIVGESGSGKTTLANVVARVTEPTDGKVWLGSEDISRSHGTELSALRKKIQMVFQDPAASLNPRQNIEEIISLPLRLAGMRDRRARQERVSELLQMVHLPADFGRRYPGSLSGGQKQRVNIARALALNPEVLVLDEPTSALDVSVQARILTLLMQLRDRHGLTYVIITHDMGVVRAVADRVAVMYLGQIVEIGTADEVLGTPRHPYTKTLLSAIPIVREEDRRLIPKIEVMDGEIPSLVDPPRHCAFLSRCPRRQEDCRRPERPNLYPTPEGRGVRCRHAEGVVLSAAGPARMT